MKYVSAALIALALIGPAHARDLSDANIRRQLSECWGMYKEQYGTLEHWKDMCKTMITYDVFDIQKSHLYETLDNIIEMKKEVQQQNN
jgi:hypothetical protein